MREMKKYHLAHHYKNFELGFGVTSAYLGLIFVLLCWISPFAHRQNMGLRFQYYLASIKNTDGIDFYFSDIHALL
jgi:hypothetical protein